jgi:hypothetical protein
VLGEALAGGFSRPRFALLLSYLPTPYVRYLRQADACFRRRLPAELCVRPAAVVVPPGAPNRRSTSHPLTP